MPLKARAVRMMSLAMPMPKKTMSSEKYSLINCFMRVGLRDRRGATPSHHGIYSSAILRPIDVVITFVCSVVLVGPSVVLVVLRAGSLGLEFHWCGRGLH